MLGPMRDRSTWAFLTPIASGEITPGPPPTFSVLIAAYNAAATVGVAIESALAQTVPPLEVIVCDDGSTDSTPEVLEAYRGRIVTIRKEQGGAASARNAALERARGDFVAILDSDDAYVATRLEALRALATVRPDLDILCTDAILEIDERPVSVFGDGCPFEVVDQRSTILERCFCVAPAYRRRAMLAVGGFDETFRTCDDWDVVIRLLLTGALAGAVAQPLYRYRLHDESVTADRVRTLAERVRMLERVEATRSLAAREQAALSRSLTAQRASLAMTAAEAALRSRSNDARRFALAAARTAAVPVRARAAALAAVLAPATAARVLDRREAETGATRLRRSVVD